MLTVKYVVLGKFQASSVFYHMTIMWQQAYIVVEVVPMWSVIVGFISRLLTCLTPHILLITEAMWWPATGINTSVRCLSQHSVWSTSLANYLNQGKTSSTHALLNIISHALIQRCESPINIQLKIFSSIQTYKPDMCFCNLCDEWIHYIK